MLDLKRLSKNELLIQNGWKAEQRVNIRENQQIFSKAFDVIEALDGTTIKNLHPELGLGEDTFVIEFDYFNYDISNNDELEEISSKIGKPVLFIGIGYDIIGDWLIDEEGIIYFRNKIKNHLHPFSLNIYDFLEKDIYKLTDLNGEYIL